jgi:hypothetical protein
MNLFWNNLEFKYGQLFEKYQTSKNNLLIAILYAIRLLKRTEKEYIEKQCPFYFENIESDSNKSQFLFALILQILSIKIIYALPHMIFEPSMNNCLSLHVVYGESVAQLVAFCLLTESSSVVNNIVRQRPKLLYEVDMTVDICDEDVLCASTTNYRELKYMLKDDYSKKMKDVFTTHKKTHDLFYNLSD